MNFKELVNSQELNETDEKFAEHITKDWRDFSSKIGKMNKQDTLKILKYIMINRPTSITLGKRAISRFNALNKARWEDLVNGNRKVDREKS